MNQTVNIEVSARLDEVAGILNEQGANRFRVGAYRRAANTIRRLERPVSEIVRDKGIEGQGRRCELVIVPA